MTEEPAKLKEMHTEDFITSELKSFIMLGPQVTHLATLANTLVKRLHA